MGLLDSSVLVEMRMEGYESASAEVTMGAAAPDPLEFVLARSGPTNAAVFLPTTSGDYSLGAYVNYDCPKETVDMLLDHIANTVAPRFEKSPEIIQLADARKLDDFAGGDAAWLGESGVIGFACRHESEVLAIVMLFRDRLSPFGPLLHS